MEDHLKKVLTGVVEAAIATGEPVGSQFLVDNLKMEVSPATVRNYFMKLEQDGYIMQPHTSAGRMPTEKGYKYFVEALMPGRHLSKKEILELEAAIQDAEDSGRMKIKNLAKTAAEISQSAVFLGLGESDSYYTGLSHLFAQPEFKDWSRIVSMSDVLDRLDEVLSGLREVQYPEPKILIGDECPFGPMCSAVVITTGNQTMGLLGPMRMDYALNTTLVKKIQEILK